MLIDFAATEAGYINGLGGASNATSKEQQHYILFGKQDGDVYFEYDNQIHGRVGQVIQIAIHSDRIDFKLTDSNAITVRRNMDQIAWNEFIAGIQQTFRPSILI